jgi:hypothetical protein
MYVSLLQLLTDTVFSSASSSSSAANSQAIDQLKYDNDRLKMALAQRCVLSFHIIAFSSSINT